MDILDSVEREIAGMSTEAQESVAAKVAFALAFRLDNAGNRDSAGLARELRNTLEDLHSAFPRRVEKHDPLTALEGKRDLRVVRDAS